MNITTGKMMKHKKVVVYGPEGIGKSTFASKFPHPVFIDTEGSTSNMDVARFDAPSSWQMLLDQVEYVIKNPTICETLVIDSVDWAEQQCVESILSKFQKSGIEDFLYGNGYVYVKEEFGRFLNKLQDVVDKGVNVVLTAHCQIRKFEQPDELGAYDRYELKLGKKTSSQTSPLVKEWSDMMLFANYKTYAVSVDKDGKKHKAQGGKRTMFTVHHPCWDAKNRYDLPEECDFDYNVIKNVVEESKSNVANIENHIVPDATETEMIDVPSAEEKKNTLEDPPAEHSACISPDIPKALRDLMLRDNVDEGDIQEVCAAKGYYPTGTPLLNYDPDFINGCLVAAWPQVYEMILTMRKNTEIPFN